MIFAAVLVGWFLLSVVVALLLAAVFREGDRLRAEEVLAQTSLASTEVSAASPATPAAASAEVPAQAPREFPLAS